ncbi:MAG: hypothetical protein OXL40_05365 [Bacteroidota bacterium]|nr:hypothetical protein [Bacteroidota bacterium]
MNDGKIGTSSEVSRLFRKRKLSCDEANRLTQLIGNMASENIIARLESKIDANAKIQNARYLLIIWAIGFAGIVISLAIIFGD